MTARLLVGDVGGTKTALAVLDANMTPIHEVVVSSRDYPSLERIVGQFLRASEASIERAHFAVAGPVENGAAQITNLPWTLEEGELARALRIPSVVLVNDLQASAYGMLFLDPSDFATLHAGAASAANASFAVIAPGTGLGEALLDWDGSRHLAIPSDGGHADFAAQSDQEIALLRHLTRRFGHVSYERVLSGDGINTIYSFLRERGPEEPAWLTEHLASGDRNAARSDRIGSNGLEHGRAADSSGAFLRGV